MTALRLLLATVALASNPLFADVINFDNVNARGGNVPLSDYQGFSWTNFSVYTTTPGLPGFNNSIVSAPNAAFSGGQANGTEVIGKITSTTPFDFTYGFVGSGHYENLLVTAQGLVGGQVLFMTTITASAFASQMITAGFVGIDTLVFSSSITGQTYDPYNCGTVNCTQFTVDDLYLTLQSDAPGSPASIPEPASVGLCALAIPGLVLLRHCLAPPVLTITALRRERCPIPDCLETSQPPRRSLG